MRTIDESEVESLKHFLGAFQGSNLPTKILEKLIVLLKLKE